MKPNKKKIGNALCILLTTAIITASFTACQKKIAIPNPLAETTTAETTTEAVPMTYYTAAPGHVKKNETVYVNLDETGGTKSTIVSDWLHTDKACVKVTDKSDLQNIVNIKSAINPVREESGLIWHMDSTDLYYRGTGTKALPVTIGIQYYLDGKEIKPAELGGKSGKVEIRIHATNNVSRKVKIAGKEQNVYSPLLLVGGMILPEDKFSGVEVDNGKTIGDGSKEIAVFFGAPGMNETLGLGTLNLGSLELDFADSFTVRADVKDFELSNMYFAVLPLSTLIADMEIPKTVADLKETIDKLSSLQDALSAIDPTKLIDALVGSGDKIKEFTEMLSDAVELYQTNKALLALMPKYATEENIKALTKLMTDLDNADAAEVQKLMSNPVLLRFIKGLPELAEDLNAVMPIVEQLRTDLKDPKVKAALDALPQTLSQLAAIESKIDENRELIDTLGTLLSEENINKISNLLDSADKAKIADLLSDYGVLAESSDRLIEALSAMLDPASNYTIYSQAAAGMETSVMFIYQTPSIAKSAK